MKYNNFFRLLMMAVCRRFGYLIKNDELYVRLFYFCGMWRNVNLKRPLRDTEKLQWLKLYERRDDYTNLVDKIAAKEYVKEILGEQYLIPTIAIYDNVQDVDFDSLPSQFVLKCTHDSGGIVVCKDKKKLNVIAARKKLSWGLKHSFVAITREYPYEKVPRRLIAEQYMVDESGTELKDYKIFCFDGEPKFLFVATDRCSGHPKFDFFDLDWNWLPIVNGHPNNPERPVKPKNWEEMLEVAKRLSKGYRHMRVDLYNVNGKVYFGEMTFFHFCGVEPFEPDEWDYKFGEYLKLPTDKNDTNDVLK